MSHTRRKYDPEFRAGVASLDEVIVVLVPDRPRPCRVDWAAQGLCCVPRSPDSNQGPTSILLAGISIATRWIS